MANNTGKNPFRISQMMNIGLLIFLSYDIWIGHAKAAESDWSTLIPALVSASHLSEDQVNTALMVPGTARDILIRQGAWSHSRVNGHEQYTFNRLNNDRCRGLMFLWQKQDRAFPMDITVNGQSLAIPNEKMCPHHDNQHVTVVLTTR